MTRHLFLLILAVVAVLGAKAQPLMLKAVQVGRHIDIYTGEKMITSYRFYEDEKYPYFFPVNGPVSGGSLTAMRNALYPHQSSLYLTSDKLNGADYWQEGLEAGQIHSMGPRIDVSEGETVILEDECIWKKPGKDASVRDKRRIAISAPSDRLYQMDFDIEMEMLEDVTIEKTIHSLFCVRMAEDLSLRQGGKVINSRGAEGIDGCFGQVAEWMDYSGERKSGKEGIAILQHPSSTWFPAPWFVRDYGLFSASRINWPQNGQDTRFPKGEKLRFRYRVMIHAGDAQDAEIDRIYKEFSKQ